jgi:biopolymer transport protein ExbD
MHPIAELNVTNLIDLGFTLLIIFMIATPLINQEQTIPVNLPVVSKSPQTKPDPDQKFESISIKADGSIVLGSQPMTVAQLSAELAKFAAQPKPPVFRLRWDAKANGQQIASVWSELEKNKLSKVSIDTQTSH